MSERQIQMHVFIQAPDPERVESYLVEKGFGKGTAIGRGMLLMDIDEESGAVDAIMRLLNSDMFLRRRVNRVYLCDSSEEDIGASIRAIESRIDAGMRFRVVAYPKAIEGTIIDRLDSSGAVLDPKGFTQVAYIVSIMGKHFLGLSGRDRYFARSDTPDNQLSRAYYKIAEAFERFGMNIDSKSRVLDIGSAPGGWSQYLSDRAGLCVAVDPAKMEIERENIEHIEKTFQEGIKEIEEKAPYDLIVCDANIDPRHVADFIVGSPGLVSSKGTVIITLKLKYKSGKSVQKVIDETSNIMSKVFNSITVKRLLSNTLMEATLCARA
ncbi:MAG: RlmE/FtsJ family methyltransferase [Candidatus Micrarchaeia archaeon]